MHKINEVQNNHFEKEENSIDLVKIMNKLLAQWYWFLLSIFICLLAAYLYAKYTAPVYFINSKVLINEKQKGGGADAGALMDLGGLMGSANSVDNEAEVLKTRFLMEQVVRKMKLNIVYSKQVRLGTREIYASPFTVDIIKGVDTLQYTKLEIEKLSGSLLKVSTDDFEKEIKWNESFQIKGIGTLQIVPALNTEPFDGTYYAEISSIDGRVATLMSLLAVEVTNKQVSIIDLNLSYPLQKKGEDILKAIIDQYITSNLLDKNIIADSTTKFIQNRLSLIAGELGDVENKQEQFKQTNQLADMSEQSKLLVQNTASYRNELAKSETQVTIVQDLEDYLKDENKNKRIFPTSLLPSDMVFSEMMNQYNSLLIERDRQLLSVTEESPFIKNIDNQIAGIRRGILGNIQSTKKSFIANRDKLRSQLNQVETRIGDVPQIEKNYLKIARNQQIKQELYIFLMQKAEETAISKSANISIAKVIDPPKASISPISPKKNVIYVFGMIAGLFIPLVFILVYSFTNTTILSKTDITSLTSVPIIGEISHNQSSDNLIVANQGRSMISEQFRALRTNLSFYLKNQNEKIILLTSSMSGEGKSFTAINLGNIMALTGKRVLLMELDLRKPGLSAKLGISNHTGFSNYTINPDLKVADIIKPLSINPNMFIVSSGPLPPNPAETLMSEHTAGLMEQLKQQFDYIIIDAPPVGIITDAQLLAQYADVSIYMVRQKITRKAQISIVEDLYRSDKMKNLGIVVNDVSGNYDGYGYGGYGNYGQEAETGFIDRLKKKFKKG
ncbi:GumC family protein [Pedobacter metabolipauper]|uniref:non-specific protein-tyrosine kinase n=1 Tax=Pedobacter metabolipauper TaxID=425513 RepID=A0A4R6SZ03_9SPHI|nr:polysaccharide biosynthesis tyrosine autokinase [Pedobacter metabolipauper]TDQ09952.1 capsular exopolysaccharide synthesis family protein [Pedobacter metabolipauper]